MVCNFIKTKLRHSCFPVHFPKFWLKIVVEKVLTDAGVKWSKEKCIHKISSQENTGDGFFFSAVADM